MLDWFHAGFRDSAFKHGQSREDIIHALANKIGSHELPSKWGQDRELIVGPNLRGILIEVIFSINANINRCFSCTTQKIKQT